MSAGTQRLWIKICGLRTQEAIEAAATAGADAVGFVFHAGSPRNLGTDEASALRAAVPPHIERVAVFLHPSQALVDAAVAALQPHWLQTDAEDLLRLQVPEGLGVLPVYRSGGPLPARLPSRLLYEGARSGHGELPDWNVARELASRAALILGGGLDAANVGRAVRSVHPFGVDVSSGVEKTRGEKDPARIREFVEAARAAERAGAEESE